MAKRFRNHNLNQYVFFLFDNALELNNVVHRKRTLYYKLNANKPMIKFIANCKQLKLVNYG